MPKLFVALDLPPTTTAELALLQPPRAPGVRLVKRNQMHLTLHYLGRAGVSGTAAALEEVKVPAFSVAFEGVGLFPSADGAVTLWAGVSESAGLLALHAAVAAALAGSGFRPEARPYSPHVTLARCAPKTPRHMIDEFLAGNERFSLPPIAIREFSLYSSTLVGDVPAYRRERSFALLPSGGEGEL